MAVDHLGTGISKSLIGFGGAGRRTVGIISELAETARLPICAVLVNAGALRRIGPNRIWVELARRWAARGVPAAGEGVADRFVLVGLCSSASLALQAALQDERVAGGFLINL